MGANIGCLWEKREMDFLLDVQNLWEICISFFLYMYKNFVMKIGFD